MVNCLSLWGSAMFGADAADESLGYVRAVFGLALPHHCAVAAEPPATVLGGGHGGSPGHESDSFSTSSEGSSSCESSDSDVRIIEPPVGREVPTDLAFSIGAEERPTGPNQGGAGLRAASASDNFPLQGRPLPHVAEHLRGRIIPRFWLGTPPRCACRWRGLGLGRCTCLRGHGPRRRCLASLMLTGLHLTSRRGTQPELPPFPDPGSPAPLEPPIGRWLTDTSKGCLGALAPLLLGRRLLHLLWRPHPTLASLGERMSPPSPTPWAPTRRETPLWMPAGHPAAGKAPQSGRPCRT